MEELGRGAFGKVHKGILKENPKVEVFFKPREERVEINEGRVVAIKVLLGKKTQKQLYLSQILLYVVKKMSEAVITDCYIVGVLSPTARSHWFKVTRRLTIKLFPVKSL